MASISSLPIGAGASARVDMAFGFQRTMMNCSKTAPWVVLAAMAMSCGNSGDDATNPDSGPVPIVDAAASPDTGAPFAGEIPLQAFEAVRKDMKGQDRTAQPVAAGVPFTDAMAVGEIDGRPALAVSGATRWQLRTLAHWPSGHVRWALATLLADVPANGSSPYKVTAGNGTSGQPDLATETADAVTVDTGRMQVTLRKHGFNLFDHVMVDGVEVVAPGSVGPVVDGLVRTYYQHPDDPPGPSNPQVDAGRAGAFTASADPAVSVTIEENGPERVVILVKGSHRDPSGARMLGYFMRLHFSYGNTWVRAFHSLTYDSQEQPTEAPWISAEPFGAMQLRTTLAAPPSAVRVSTAAEPLDTSPGASDPVTFHQYWPDDNRFRQYYQQDNPPASLCSYNWGMLPDWKLTHPELNGWAITRGASELKRGDAASSPDLQWMDASSADGRGILVGIRFAAGHFPKSLSAAADGTVSVGLFPGEGTWWQLGAGTHNTNEVLYEFHAKHEPDPSSAMFRFQYPLVGKVSSADWFNEVTGPTEIYPLYHFVDSAKEMASVPGTGEQRGDTFQVWRCMYWGEGGYYNQHDFARVDLVDFVRDSTKLDRAGENFLAAESRFGYNADWAVKHGDIQSDGMGGKIQFEFEHPHWYGMPLDYYLTGDRRIMDAAVEFAYAQLADRGTDTGAMYGWARVFGWAMYTFAAGYDLTHDEKFRDAIRWHVNYLTSGAKAAGGGFFVGADPIRGAFGSGEAWKDPSQHISIKPGLMLGYIIHDGLWNAREQFSPGDPTRDQLEDWVEGIEWLLQRESYRDDPANSGQGVIQPALYSLNHDPEETDPYQLPFESYNALVMPLLVNGEAYDPLVPGLFDKAVWSAFNLGFYRSHPDLQAALYYLNDVRPGVAGLHPPPPIADLKAEALGGGKVRLSWTQPEDATRVQVRYADRKIVANLDYDRTTKAFKFDPDQYANWWAAAHATGGPDGAPATQRSFVVEGIPVGKRVFAARTWSSAQLRSAVSTLAEVTVL